MGGVGDEAAKSRQEERRGQWEGDLDAPRPRRPAPDDSQEEAQVPRLVGGVHRGLPSGTGRGLGHNPDLPEHTAAGQRLRNPRPRSSRAGTPADPDLAPVPPSCPVCPRESSACLGPTSPTSTRTCPLGLTSQLQLTPRAGPHEPRGPHLRAAPQGGYSQWGLC